MTLTGPLGSAKVIESTQTAPGTGTFTLGGAFGLGSQTFVAAVGSGNIAFYVAEDADGSNWEEGFGTATAGVPDDTLTRTFVFASSNGGAKVNFTTAPTVFIGSLGGGPGNSALSGNKGSSRPGWLQAGGRWIDDTNDPVWTINLFDGDEDIAVADFNTTTGRFSLKPMLGDLEVESTDAGSGAGPAFTAYRNSPSPAVNDLLGQFKFRGKSSTGVDRLYALLHAQLLDPTNGAEDGQYVLQSIVAGVMTTIMAAGANGVAIGNPTGGTPGFGVVNAEGLQINGTNVLLTGEVKQYIGTTAPTGWLLLNGDSIGSAASGADQADDGLEDLFKLFWDSMADAQAPVSGGRGASAQADWDADKTLTMPDARGRSVLGSGTGSGLTARTHGDTDGAETHTLTVAEMPAHAHTHAASAQDSCTNGARVSPISGAGSLATSSEGGGGAHNNMQPWLALNFIVKT